MNEPVLHHVTCTDVNGAHRMAWWFHGDPGAAHLVVCAHGLTRQGRDFDVLAQALVERCPHPVRVVCPDVVGRGRSDWLSDPAGYQIAQYVSDMLALLQALQQAAPIGRLDWVGTSMGGLIGMVLAGQEGLNLPVPVMRLVLNDVGPVIQWPALQRIGQHLGKTGHFDTEQQAADALWAVSASFGFHTPQQWLALCRPMLRAEPRGGFTLHYDPDIAVPFAAVTAESMALGEAYLWQAYDSIRARTLLVRGAESDLLTRPTALAMTLRGPCARLVEFDGVGHAPMFAVQPQVDAVCDFLLGPDTAAARV
jgi:pimeloyl-ACP methyl ester carboxylesterase